MDLVVLLRIQENCQKIRIALQRIVRAPADDHAGLLRRNLLDRVELREKDLMIQRQRPVAGRNTEAVAVHDQGVQETVRRLLVVALQNLRGKAALFRSPVQKLLVIVGNTQLFRKCLPYGASARSRLTSDRNQNLSFFHVIPPRAELLLYIFYYKQRGMTR